MSVNVMHFASKNVSILRELIIVIVGKDIG